MTIDNRFLGRGWDFPPTFNPYTHSVEMLSGEADIHSSLRILIETITGERVMQPRYGINLRPYLFESLTPSNIALIETIIRDAIVIHEPRIIPNELIIISKPDDGLLEIKIEYTIILTNTRHNKVFPFYLKEATHLIFKEL
jgi:uncharacterized protein